MLEISAESVLNNAEIDRNFLLDCFGREYASVVGVPKIQHCIGERRLLGQYFALSIAQSSNVIDLHKFNLLHQLSLLLRSYVVIDDFLRDRITNVLISNNERQLLGNISRHIESWCKELDIKVEVFNEALLNVNRSYDNHDYLSDFDLVIGKCSLVFLPGKIIQQDDVRRRVQAWFEKFLFLLQLADDYCDLEEDQISGVRHNVYTRKLVGADIGKVMNYKSVLGVNLLRYIVEETKKLDENSTSLMQKLFVRFACKWAVNILRDIEGVENLPYIDSGFFRNPSSQSDLLFSAVKCIDSIPALSKISAESMHSAGA